METMSRHGFVGSVGAGTLLALALAAPIARQVTERVSVDSAGVQGNSGSGVPSISADGHYVAFTSYASNLVSGDTNGQLDVFVHDRQSGATERVSVDSAGAQGNRESYDPSISADGRCVAFHSWATNLVSGDTNGLYDVFVHDRQSGATERVSIDSAGMQVAAFLRSPPTAAAWRSKASPLTSSAGTRTGSWTSSCTTARAARPSA